MKTVETYGEQKSRHSKEYGEFEGIFFAFNNEQFKEGMIKVGIADNDTTKILSLGHGGFIRKDRKEAFLTMLERHDKEIKERRKEEKFLFDSLVYELRNHEYCITYDHQDALKALGLEAQDVDPNLLKKACKMAI